MMRTWCGNLRKTVRNRIAGNGEEYDPRHAIPTEKRATAPQYQMPAMRQEPVCPIPPAQKIVPVRAQRRMWMRIHARERGERTGNDTAADRGGENMLAEQQNDIDMAPYLNRIARQIASDARMFPQGQKDEQVEANIGYIANYLRQQVHMEMVR